MIYCITNVISLNCSGSNVDSPKWLKNKKATINPKNKDDKYFPYTATAALNHQNIRYTLERITKILFFIDQRDWK